MSGRPWKWWLGPPIALVVVALALSQLQAGAEAGGRTTPPAAGACPTSPLATNAAGKPARDVGPVTWWKLAEQLDDNGAMTGRRLAVGRGGSTSLLLDLPAESVANGPIGGVVVVATDDGRSSEIRLLSAPGACSWLVDTTADVVRAVILDPGDGSVIAHLVDRATRADLGTWRFGARGALARPALVAAALPEGSLDGPAWITDLRLDVNGRLLAVQSCTDTGCLARVFDLGVPDRPPATLRGGRAGQHATGAQGPLLGFSNGRLVTWAACAGFPCQVETWDLATGTSQVLLDSASAAAVTPDGRFLVATTDAPSGRTLRIELATGTRALVKGLRPDELLLPGGAAATSGLQLGSDEVAVTAPGANPRSFRPAAAEVLP
jgi:hypothetical protein